MFKLIKFLLIQVVEKKFVQVLTTAFKTVSTDGEQLSDSTEKH